MSRRTFDEMCREEVFGDFHHLRVNLKEAGDGLQESF